MSRKREEGMAALPYSSPSLAADTITNGLLDISANAPARICTRDMWRPGRDLPQGVCELCQKMKDDHPIVWAGLHVVGSLVAGEVQAPSRRKSFNWPLTQEIRDSYIASGFTEMVLRNPKTGEEAIMLPPAIISGVCGTCGRQVAPPNSERAKDV